VAYRGIIFDLDGTLVDTLDDLTAAMNASLEKLGCPQRNPDECRQMIGHGLRMFAARALGPDRQELTDELVTTMVAYYQEHCLGRTRVYEGLDLVVEVLKDRGVRLAVLTNKNQSPAQKITQHYFGADLFDPIVGAGSDRTPKPDPETTLKILSQWSLTAEEVLFVGDSEPDMQTAKAAGLKAIGCEWGFRSPEVLTEAGADILISHPQQIMDLI
jgi:phosphoglycolate phosphatase